MGINPLLAGSYVKSLLQFSTAIQKLLSFVPKQNITITRHHYPTTLSNLSNSSLNRALNICSRLKTFYAIQFNSIQFILYKILYKIITVYL
jgi:hypothetical protein